MGLSHKSNKSSLLVDSRLHGNDKEKKSVILTKVGIHKSKLGTGISCVGNRHACSLQYFILFLHKFSKFIANFHKILDVPHF